jgi:hypothetical protein
MIIRTFQGTIEKQLSAPHFKDMKRTRIEAKAHLTFIDFQAWHGHILFDWACNINHYGRRTEAVKDPMAEATLRNFSRAS